MEATDLLICEMTYLVQDAVYTLSAQMNATALDSFNDAVQSAYESVRNCCPEGTVALCRTSAFSNKQRPLCLRPAPSPCHFDHIFNHP